MIFELLDAATKMASFADTLVVSVISIIDEDKDKVSKNILFYLSNDFASISLSTSFLFAQTQRLGLIS